MKQFEESLYVDLVESIKDGDPAISERKKIEVLAGGKQGFAAEKTLIDLQAARKRRKLGPISLLN